MPRKVETIATDPKNADPSIAMVDREIGHRKFKVTQYHVITGLAVMARVTNLVMPLLGKLSPYLEKDGEGGLRLKSTEPADLAVPLATIFSSVGDDKLVGLVRDLLRQTQVFIYAPDGTVSLRPLDTDAAINRTFGGDLKTILAVCAFSIQVNFADFFRGTGEAKGATPETPSHSS
jgi:hypothetical protein